MSRAMGMKFTPASKGDSYDKMNFCSGCFAEPKDKPFMICAACKEASFCSKECQKKAWPLHKTFCQMRKNTVASMADAPSSADFPPFAIRKRLLTDFIEVHECSVQSALYSAIVLCGHMESFPYDSRALRFYLKYNPACKENPSIAYTLHAYQWFDDRELRAKLHNEGFERLMEQANGRPGFCGWLRVYFRIEDHVVQESYPQQRKQDPIGNALEVLQTQLMDHKPWFERLQKVVKEGLVKRAVGEHDAVMQMGRMKMKKGKWVWIPLTDAELKAGGHQKHMFF
ncbi:hypothetical protein C8F01DRAFT_1188477 [Mycena amicta]|nr:hypothetical protein C8F01DRAFT_1188477 [Mycena amicta]